MKTVFRPTVRWLCVVAFGFLSPSIRAASPPPPDGEITDFRRMSLEELMQLDVTSVSKRPEPFSHAPAAIQVVTQEDIRRSGASSIPEALRLASNLQVAQKNSHDWAISARGFNTELANKLLVLMDGRTVYTPLYSGVFWDVQDYLLEDIDRIEVISGPGGALWGANAVNGVINITTKSAKDTQGFYMEAGGGSWQQDFVGLRYGGALATNVFFRVYGKYFDREELVRADGQDASDAWRMGRGGFRLDAELAGQNTLTFQGDIYAGEEAMAGLKQSQVSGGNVLGRWTHVFSEDSDMSLQVYYDRTHLALPKAAVFSAGAGTLKDDLDTYDLDFQHRLALAERHRLVWGAGYRFTHDNVRNAPSLVFLPEELDHHLFSGFVQDEIRLREELFLTLGTKLEHNDYTGAEVEPSARLQWNLHPKHMVWAAVSRAVRTPSRVDRDLDQPTGLPAPFPASILRGNPDFDSETVLAYELGYRAQLTPKLAGSLSLFFNDYDDLRSTTPGPAGFPSFGFPLVFDNNLKGETYGVEVSVSYQLLTWWRLKAGYNWLESDLRVKDGTVDFSNGHNETADPKHQVSLSSSMNLPRDVELDAGLRWIDTLHNNNGPNVGTVPSYFALDVRVSWRPIKELEISVVGQSLLDDRHPEYGFPSPARTEIERSVYAKVAWRW